MIGQSVKRYDDVRLLTGLGRYTDDLALHGALHAVFVRSPHAHAKVVAIDTAPARRLPGVVAVFTASDLLADGIGPLASGIGARAAEHPNRDGSLMTDLPIRLLACDRVRFVGDPIAVVLAESADAARDAAEAVAVSYALLPAVVDCRGALAEGVPELWSEVPRNLVFDYGAGDAAGTDSALASARHVIAATFVDNRVAACFTEPRAALATYDATAALFHLTAGVQSVHGIRKSLARVLGCDFSHVRVTSPDTGGAFGARSVLYPEYAVLLWAARCVDRPIKWLATRSEEFQATTQGRDAVLTGTLGLDTTGRMLALKVEGVAAFGARHAGNGPFSTMRNLERMLPAVYDIPALYLHLEGAFTNTTPISSYRGVGRIEANYVIERLIELAATSTGIDRIELRRINAIKSTDLPKVTPVGSRYDSGDYASNMDIAQRAASWATFEARRKEAAGRGRLRGIALANYIEGAGGAAGEYARVAVASDGRVSVAAGCVDQGQGQATVLRQIVAEVLGIAAGDILTVATDTSVVADGVGTNASRSTVRAGKAVAEAAAALVESGRRHAARLLQADAAALEFRAGAYHIDGTGRSVSLFDVARAEPDGIAAEIRHEDETVTYPNGTHVAEVEIDPETGLVVIVQFVAVDDVGCAVNPMLVAGQSQGGIAQGIGQALMEHVRFDADSGQLLTGSFMDYAIPRACDLPALTAIPDDHPSPFTPFGIKGAGEGGATGAPAAVINAVLHALAPLGVSHIDMPATPERVWRAIRAVSN
ncbi:MAG: hypothetical protein RLZ98_941 [Pseudomonadota bacterium]